MALLQNLAQPLTNVANNVLLRRIDTGDRLLDAALHGVATLLASAAVGSTLKTLRTPRLLLRAVERASVAVWLAVSAACLCRCRRRAAVAAVATANGAAPSPATYEGTEFHEFDAAHMTLEQRKASRFKWKIVTQDFACVAAWMLKVHPQRHTLRKDAAWTVSSVPLGGAENILPQDGSFLPAHIWDQQVTRLYEYAPVWLASDGEWVFLHGDEQGDNRSLALLCDSRLGISECVYHMEAMSSAFVSSVMGTKAYSIHVWKSASMSFCVGRVSRRRTFEGMHFPQKAAVLQLLDRLKAGTLVPEGAPLDPKLGILLHGPPGCGKSCLISAIANYLGRNIHVLDLKVLRTRSALDAVLTPDRAASGVIVLDEIDCMIGALQDRGAANAEYKQGEGAAMVAAVVAAVAAAAAKPEDRERAEERKADDLDLGYLLSKLDGIEDGSGRVIIATTNYPERLDRALLRPGRFGFHVRLGRCTREMLRGILCMMMCGAAAAAAIEAALPDLPEDAWTPSEVLQLTQEHGDVEAVLAALRAAPALKSQALRS